MKAVLYLSFLLAFAAHAETWKLEYSNTLRAHAPGMPQYADQSYSSKDECERAVDAALGNQSKTYMRTHYRCFLESSSSTVSTNAPVGPPGLRLGEAIVKGIFTPEQTGHNIVGENDFAEFGGQRPDALGRHNDKFGFIASVPKDNAESVKPHQLPSKNAEKVCAQMKQLSCFSTRGFIGCCPKGFSYLAAPTGMAPMGDICATQSADSAGQQCLCYVDNAICINSKQGMCYGCSEM